MSTDLPRASHLEAVRGHDHLVRLRTHQSSDFVVFQIVFALGAAAGAYFLGWPVALLALAVAIFAAWVRGHRTTVDLQARTFASRAPWIGGETPPRPLLPLAVRKSVKRSKGTVTITYAVLGNGVEVVDGLPWLTAKELVEELAALLGTPAPPIPE